MFNYGTKFAGLGFGTFPTFAAKNASGPTATDGFPYTADSVNDWIGFTQALLNRAGLTPNGNAEVDGASQLVTALTRGAGHTPGILVQTAISQEKMAQNRLLLLAGQIIDITGAYAEMAANVYVGDAQNPSAEAFYKCGQDGARDINGSFMKLPDCRGIFLRGAGSQTRAAEWTDYAGTPRSANTVYDGGATGKWTADRIREIYGNPGSPAINSPSGVFHLVGGSTHVNRDVTSLALINMHASIQVPTGPDNAPASVSVYTAITY
jgi:hypothetical protein